MGEVLLYFLLGLREDSVRGAKCLKRNISPGHSHIQQLLGHVPHPGQRPAEEVHGVILPEGKVLLDLVDRMEIDGWQRKGGLAIYM